MNEHDKCVNAVINELECGDFVGRIWRRDHTVWSSETEEVIHGVEWLNAIDKMSGLSTDLKDFAKNIVEDGFDELLRSFESGIIKEEDFEANNLDAITMFFKNNEKKLLK